MCVSEYPVHVVHENARIRWYSEYHIFAALVLLEHSPTRRLVLEACRGVRLPLRTINAAPHHTASHAGPPVDIMTWWGRSASFSPWTSR